MPVLFDMYLKNFRFIFIDSTKYITACISHMIIIHLQKYKSYLQYLHFILTDTEVILVPEFTKFSTIQITVDSGDDARPALAGHHHRAVGASPGA